MQKKSITIVLCLGLPVSSLQNTEHDLALHLDSYYIWILTRFMSIIEYPNEEIIRVCVCVCVSGVTGRKQAVSS